MDLDIKLAKKIFIRNAGKNEFWLQDLIYQKPEILGLGDLIPIGKERTHSSGGRLDILLKNPKDSTMYEVEVMLGETDPSHIIRTIEYWDNEKRRYPQRQHFAVLIAESFDRRYFNVIQLLSLNIPMIAIQADLLEVNDGLVLNFTKILNVYEEPEDSEETQPATELTWQEKAPWTVELAKKHSEILSEFGGRWELRYTQSYINLCLDGRILYRYDKRTKPDSFVWFKVSDEEKVEAIKEELSKSNIDFNYNQYQDFSFTLIDRKKLIDNAELIKGVQKIRDKRFTAEQPSLDDSL